MNRIHQIQFSGGSFGMHLFFCMLMLVPVSNALIGISPTSCSRSKIFGVVTSRPSIFVPSSSTTRRKLGGEANDFDSSSVYLDESAYDDDDDENDINFLFDDSDDPDKNNKKEGGGALGRQRWDNIRPTIKKRLIEKGQAKAIANKKKREPAADKKRRKYELTLSNVPPKTIKTRSFTFCVSHPFLFFLICVNCSQFFCPYFHSGMMMKFKELQGEKKRNSRVKRPLGFEERAPLTAFSPGMEVTGTVISFTNYGAYIDVGTECDGLLHISQITRNFFVEHPRQVLTPGEEVTVRIRSASPELKKMQLTMLDEADVDDSSLRDVGDNNTNKGTALEEFEIDDELWGEMKRVTDFGSYIDVGAEVDAFLHFMDHPSWEDGMIPAEFMERGQRVRVWVADLDLDRKRIRATGCRPPNLPGPKFEF